MKTTNTFLWWKQSLPETTEREVAQIYLAVWEVWSGVVAPETQIFCERGIVWLTHSNDPHDHILHLGERFLATSRGKVVVQALTAATMTVVRSEKHLKERNLNTAIN